MSDGAMSRSRSGGRRAGGFPIEPGLPLFGHLLALRQGRLALQRRLATEHREAVWIRAGMFHVLVISSPELAHEVLVERNDAFVKSPALSVIGRPVFGDGLLTSERELHRRQRRMLAPIFTQRRVGQYAEVMTERAERAQARWGDGEVVEAVGAMMRLTLEIVGKTLFGVEVDGPDAEQIGQAVTHVMEHVVGSATSLVPVPPFVPTPRNLRYLRTVGKLDAIVYRMIRERREGGEERGDLLSLLLAARDEDGQGRMDDRQIRDEAVTLLLAGHETTANALAWSLYLLSGAPRVLARLEEEVDRVLAGPATFADLPRLPYTLAVLKEAMRLYPPAYVVTRLAAREVEIGGERVKRRSIALVNIYGMHHAERYFPEAERFEPERFLGEAEGRAPRGAYLPFGAGPRVCIGNHFALMEGQLVLATLARHVRLELMPGQRIAPEPLITLRPRYGLRMRVRRRGGRG